MAFGLLASIACAVEVRVTKAGQIEARGSDVRVFRGDATEPLFGSVVKEGDHVLFNALLPLVPGESYRVEVKTAEGIWSEKRLKFKLTAPAVPTVSISPTPTVLPANALKLYLHFSQPMEQGVFLERITLQRQDGSIVHGAFRETELWSPDGKRLTLWLHPGRQKTGVNLNTDEGPVLQENQPHKLRIAARWRSAEGVALGKEFVFPLASGAIDHACPDPQRWKVAAPKAGTRDPLTITFDEALDPAMLVSALKVKPEVAGVVEIDPLLEDLAGNNLLGPFEVDRDAPAKAAKTTTMAFEVRG